MTLSGVYVPLITPFNVDGTVALDALRSLAQEVLRDGATGLVALGTTGEPGSLTDAERAAVVDVIAEVCREREAPLLVGGDAAGPGMGGAGVGRGPGVGAAPGVGGRGSGGRRGAAGVSGSLSLVPPFVRPGEAGVIAYFTALAAASPVPLVVYHVPLRTGQQLTARTLRALAALDGVVGVKYATGALDATIVDLLADPPPDFAVLGGDDLVISPLLALGAPGGILASAHVRTAEFAELVTAWRDGDAGRARKLGHRLAALSAALFAEPNPAVIKGVLHAQNRIPTAAVRLPLLAASRAGVESAYRQAG